MMNPNPRTSTTPSKAATPYTVTAPANGVNPPRAATSEEQAARQAEEARRHLANVQRREAAAKREETAMQIRNAPESARESVRRWRRRTPSEEREFAARRDKLHAALDALGSRVPSDADLFELVECARATFPPYQAAARVLSALTKHPAVAAVLAREEESK